MADAAPKFRPRQASAAQALDRWRGSPASRGYDHAWTLVRTAKVQRDPLCEDCLLEGRTTLADEVDHVISIKQDPTRRLDPSNLRSLCKAHHARKTRREHG